MYGQFAFTQKYTTDHGLLSNDIQAIYNDSRGILWIGSQSGVLVKNMDKFVGVIQVNENKFKNIRSIIEDNQNNIWIGSYEHGVMKLNGNDKSHVFNNKNGLLSNYVRRLYYFNNKIYVGSSKGVSVINTKNNEILNLSLANQLKNKSEISSFFQYKNSVYACTQEGDIFKIDTVNNKLHYVISYSGIYSVLPLSNSFYFGTNNGVIQYFTDTKKVKQYGKIPYVWGYASKSNGVVYFVASTPTDDDGGLFQIQNNKIERLTDKFQLPYDDLVSISMDYKNNKMFLGSRSNGLLEVVFDNPLKKIYSGKEVNILTNFSSSLFVFTNEGLEILNEKDEVLKKIPLSVFSNFQNKNKDRFRSLIKNDVDFYEIKNNLSHDNIQFYKALVHNNQVWVSSNIGLFSIDGSGNLTNYYPIHTLNFTFYKNEFIQNSISGGFRVFSDLENFKYKYYNKQKDINLPYNLVDFVTIDDKMYIASSQNGMYIYDGNQFKKYNDLIGFKELNIKKIQVCANNKLIILTAYDEIFEIDPKTNKFKKIYSNTDIKGKAIQSFLVAGNKFFLGTNKGVNVFENDLKYLIDKEQGLESYNFTNFERFNGNVYIGTKNGLFKSTEYFENVLNNYTPNVNVYNVVINGESIDKSKYYNWFSLSLSQLNLPYYRNNIKIYFTDWNAKFPKKVSFKYRLKDSENWSNTINDNIIDLPYLQPGNYKLELLIENLSTGKTYQIKLLNIKISPVFYQTWTFYVLTSIIVFLISFVIYSYNIKLVKRREEEKSKLIFLKQEEEKKRIQVENDKIVLEKSQIELQNRLNLAKSKALRSQMNPHFIFNALNTLQYFIVSHDRENGLKYLATFSKLVRETLENSINDYITLRDEIEYLKVYISIENMRFKDREVVFEYHVDDELDVDNVLIPPMMSQPFVENCFMHAFDETVKDPKIIFRYKREDGYLVCEIVDNGLGFSEKKIDLDKHKSRGVGLVKERTEMLLPELETTVKFSNKKNGVVVSIYLPYILKEYFL